MVFPRTLSKNRIDPAHILRPSSTQLRTTHLHRNGPELPRHLPQIVSDTPRHVGVHDIRHMLPPIAHDPFQRALQRIRLLGGVDVGGRLSTIGALLRRLELPRSRPAHGCLRPASPRQEEREQRGQRDREARYVLLLPAEFEQLCRRAFIDNRQEKFNEQR